MSARNKSSYASMEAVAKLPAGLQEVALVDARTAAAVGNLSVSWWLAKVASGEAPQPVIRQARFTRWSMTSVREFWALYAAHGATQAAGTPTIERAKHASRHASMKRRAARPERAAA